MKVQIEAFSAYVYLNRPFSVRNLILAGHGDERGDGREKDQQALFWN